MSYCNILLSVT